VPSIADFGVGIYTRSRPSPPFLWLYGIGSPRIFATCHPENQASERVLQKLGMQQEGYLRENKRSKGAWRDSLLYALLAQNWHLRLCSNKTSLRNPWGGQLQAHGTWRLNRQTGSSQCRPGKVPPHRLCEATFTRRLPVGFCRSHQKRHPARGNTRNGRRFLPTAEAGGIRARPW
jgi:hypothetical protein